MKKENEKEKIEISALKYLAYKNSDTLLSSEEIRNIDLTSVWEKELKDIIKNGELLNCQILGEVISGKSTVMCKIVMTINEFLGKKMSLDKIAADQLEYSRKVMDEKLNNVCIGVDEFNKMSTTGINATTEQSLLEYFSDVHAQRFIHKVGCAPKTIIDTNANIILEILGKDINKKVTRCLIFYKILKNNCEQIQLLGYVDIFVGDVLNKEWYKRYRERKFKKMELVIKEGVRDLREMEYAEMILYITEKLKNLSRIGAINREVIANYVDKSRRDNKKFLSILASDDLINKVSGILSMYKHQEKIEIEIMKTESKIEKGMNLKERMKILKTAKNEIKEMIKQIVENYKSLIKVNAEYQSI